MQKLLKTINITVIVLALFGFLFVRASLKEDSITIDQKPKNTIEVEVRPVKVLLLVNTNEIDEKIQVYEARLQNTDSVFDLLEELRKNSKQDEDYNNPEFSFEKTVYTFGTVFNHINGVIPPLGYEWRLFVSTDSYEVKAADYNLTLDDDEFNVLSEASINESDITAHIENMSLINKAVYEFKLIDSATIHTSRPQ